MVRIPDVARRLCRVTPIVYAPPLGCFLKLESLQRTGSFKLRGAALKLARLSMHLTPALFGVEARKLKQPASIIAVHIKPRYRDQILSELKELGLPNLVIGDFGKAYEW